MCVHSSVHWSSQDSQNLQLHHMYLPLIAPCERVTEGNGGAERCRARRELDMHELSEFPLIPAPNAQKEATVRPLSTSEGDPFETF